MEPFVIEREVQIDAPVEVVWRVLTSPEHVARWFSERAEFELRVDADGLLTFRHPETGVVSEAIIHIVRVDEPHAFAFRWCHPQGEVATDVNSTLVEFSLAPEGSGTRLRVVESGGAALNWTAEARDGFVEDHRGGWHTISGRIREYAPTLA